METGGDPLNVTAEVACITQSSEFFINGSQWQGILGLGYKAISQVWKIHSNFYVGKCTKLYWSDKFTKAKIHIANEAFMSQICNLLLIIEAAKR